MCARGGTTIATAPKTMSAHHKPIVHAAPVVDEWGIYDPDRAGLAAVFAKLEAKLAPHTLARASLTGIYERR